MDNFWKWLMNTAARSFFDGFHAGGVYCSSSDDVEFRQKKTPSIPLFIALQEFLFNAAFKQFRFAY
jgi:hypothetical protein